MADEDRKDQHPASSSPVPEKPKDQNPAPTPAPTDQEDPNENKPFAPQFVGWMAMAFFTKALVATWGLLLTLAVGLGILSFHFSPESYWQHLCIEMCSGITGFLLTPLIVSWSRNSPVFVRSLLGVASVGCAVAGFYEDGAKRLFFIEWTVMFGFLLGLELVFREWFDYVNEVLSLSDRA
jgi:hypothetical protein